MSSEIAAYVFRFADAYKPSFIGYLMIIHSLHTIIDRAASQGLPFECLTLPAVLKRERSITSKRDERRFQVQLDQTFQQLEFCLHH